MTRPLPQGTPATNEPLPCREVTPFTDYAKTIVEYRAGYPREAQRLAADVGVTLVGPLDGLREPDVVGAHVALVLGR